MKKKILTLILPAVAMIAAGCGEQKPSSCTHKDENYDHVCDLCNYVMSDHTDSNDDGKCDYCGSIVQSPIVVSVDIVQDSLSINKGDSQQLTVNVETKYSAAKDVSWSSSNEDVVTVSSSGLVSAVAEGDAVITAKSIVDNSKFDTVSVHVSNPGTGEEELEKFNELVSSIKTNHNYRLDVISEVEDFEEEENYYDNFTNYNNLAFESKDFDYGLDGFGYIYQKDQGYVSYYRLGSTIVPEGFVSTNPDIYISDFYEVIAENLFLGDYVQDTENFNKFVTDSVDSIAVGCYFTGFSAYIKSGQLQCDDSMEAYVDVENNQITIKMNYWLKFFDVEWQSKLGLLTILIKDIGEVDDAVYKDYIADPSTKFVAPTKWSDDDKACFDKKFNGIYPTFPEGLTYAYSTQVNYFDGYEYAIVEDKASGDLRSSYGTVLLNDGYTLNGTDNYKKVVDSGEFDKITYTVKFKYYEPTIAYPNGVMAMFFRSQTDLGYFDSIEKFNTYLSVNKYDELVPALPAVSSSFSKIDNFKNTTAGSESYALKVNSTDTFHVWISNYSVAQNWVNSYVTLLNAKGYSDASSFLGMTNYGLEWSSTGTYVGVDFPAEASYKGWVGIRYIVTKDDEASLRPAPKDILSSITLTGMTTSYTAGDTFSFDGVCTAHYENADDKVVTPTNVSSPNMTVAGTKTVTVTYTEGDITVNQTYQITVAKRLITLSYEADEHVKSVSFKDYEGNPITQYDPSGEIYFIACVELDEGYTFKTFSVEGDSSAEVWLGENENEYWIIPGNTSVSSMNIIIETIETDPPTPTVYKINKDSVTGITFSIAGMITEAEEGDVVKFTIALDEGYTLDGMPFIKNYPEIEVTSTVNPMTGATTYMFDMPNHDVTISANVTAPVATVHSINKDTVEGVTFKIAGMITEAEEGDVVKFTIALDEGYTLDGMPFIKNYPEIEVTSTVNPMTGATTYMFDMPDHDVTISANVTAPTPTKYNVSADENIENGTIQFSKTIYAKDEKVEFDVVAAEDYKIKSVSATTGESVVVTVTDEGEGTYSFIMPEGDVVVYAEFEEDSPTTTDLHFSVSKKNAGYDLVIDIYLNADKTGSFTATRSDGYKAQYYFTWSTTDNATYTVVQDSTKASQETNTFANGNWELYQNGTNPKSSTLTVNNETLSVTLYKSGMTTKTTHTLSLVK